MITDSTIQTAVQRLKKAASPEKIILFGSYARGGADGVADNGHFMPGWVMRSQINRYPESSDR